MSIKAVTLDAYGTLLHNEGLHLIPRRIIADHRLSVSPDEVMRVWVDLYHEATLRTPFETLRQVETASLAQVLRRFGVDAPAMPYVDLFFEATTQVQLYPEVAEVLRALPVPAVIVSNADHEHVAVWPAELRARPVVISEAVGAYKPDPLIFQHALAELKTEPHETLHVGDSEMDDIRGARAAGLRVAWINRTGRRRRPEVEPPDHEIPDLRELLKLL